MYIHFSCGNPNFSSGSNSGPKMIVPCSNEWIVGAHPTYKSRKLKMNLKHVDSTGFHLLRVWLEPPSFWGCRTQCHLYVIIQKNFDKNTLTQSKLCNFSENLIGFQMVSVKKVTWTKASFYAKSGAWQLRPCSSTEACCTYDLTFMNDLLQNRKMLWQLRRCELLSLGSVFSWMLKFHL